VCPEPTCRAGLQSRAVGADDDTVTRATGRAIVLALVVLLTAGVVGLMALSPAPDAPAGSMTGHDMGGMSVEGHDMSGH